jgi:hypothetical protein
MGPGGHQQGQYSKINWERAGRVARYGGGIGFEVGLNAGLGVITGGAIAGWVKAGHLSARAGFLWGAVADISVGAASDMILHGEDFGSSIATNALSFGFGEVLGAVFKTGGKRIKDASASLRKRRAWYANVDDFLTLYRGQGRPTASIMSFTARTRGMEFAQDLLRRVRAAGVADSEIALMTAKGNTLPARLGSLETAAKPYPYELLGEPIPGLGIPTTLREDVAADFARREATQLLADGQPANPVVYTLRVPRNAAISVPPWIGSDELEHIILNEIPNEWIVNIRNIGVE